MVLGSSPVAVTSTTSFFMLNIRTWFQEICASWRHRHNDTLFPQKDIYLYKLWYLSVLKTFVKLQRNFPLRNHVCIKYEWISNEWLWTAASEQLTRGTFDVAQFLTIEISFSWYFFINIKFLKITTLEPILYRISITIKF